MSEKCQTCKFLLPYDSDKMVRPKNQGGHCRRYPAGHAIVSYVHDTHGLQLEHYYEQPCVTANDWCGEYKEKPKGQWSD